MSTRRNIVANYVGQGLTAIIALALVPVYIAYLGIESYALVGLFATLQVWLTLLDLGMTPTLGREMARFTAGVVTVQAIRDLLRSLEIVVFGLAAVVAAALWAGADWLARHWLDSGTLGPAAVAEALGLVGVVVALRFAEGIYRSAIIGLGQQVWLNGAQIALALLRGGGAVAVLALIEPTVQAFFVWQGIVSALTLAAYGSKLHLGLPRAPRRPRFSRAALASVQGFAGGMFAMTLLAVLLTQVDKLLLARLLPLAEFGYYMLASTLAGTIYLVIGPVLQAVYPPLVRALAVGDVGGLAQTYSRTAQLVAVLLAPAMLLVVLFPQPLLLAWSGDAVLAERTAPLLALLAVGTVLNAVMQVPHQLQLASGWTSLALRTNIVAILVLMPALLWAVPRYGGVAAAVIWALLNAGYVVAQVPLTHRRLLPGRALRWYWHDTALPGLAAAAVMVPLWWLVRGAALGRLEWLAVLAAAGMAGLVAAGLAASTIRVRLIAALTTVQRRRLLRRPPRGAAPR